MARSRRAQRRASTSSSSSSSTSPEREADDDDNDSFMLQANDSQSSLGMDISPEHSDNEAARLEYEERCRVSPVHRLPAELLISIFARLAAPKDLQTCMLVSKDWARNSVGLLWHRPGMHKWESIHNVVQTIRKSDKFFAYQDLVKRLNMSTLAGQVSDGSLLGMVDCKRIERLTLTNCTKLTDVSLQPLIEGNRSLLALDVTGLDQLTDRTLITVADHCLRLQGLNVTNCKKLTDASITAIAKSCRHLKRLKFNGCVQLTDTSIITVASHNPQLLEIDLHALPHIESPSITALITSCLHLRELRLAHCTRINDSAFLDLPHDLPTPFTLDSLRILDLTDCNELGDRGVERIVSASPRLRNLILAKCRHITDRAVFAITKLGKNLHYIHLGHCARITDSSIEALAKSCNRIRYVDLACCSNLTDSSVTKLAALPKLKRIGLVKCAGITDRSIYALAMGETRGGKKWGGVSVLERVHLSYCTLLTLDGIHVLLNSCPKLTHLSLTGVQAFLQDELLAFCREAPPEFNDHQRDVFCVFSGSGVERLRCFLNDRKALAAADIDREERAERGGSATPSGDSDGGGGVLRDEDLSDLSESGVVVLNIMGGHAHGASPLAVGGGGFHTPSPVGWANRQSTVGYGGAMAGPAPQLSSSAPAGSSMGMMHSWGTLDRDGGVVHFQGLYGHSYGGGVGGTWQMQPGGAVGSGTVGAAQHVTGMMGATALDDVDEGDEAFGEGSESMGD